MLPTRFENLKDCLGLLEHRHSQEVQLGLSRVFKVAQSLDLLHPNSTVITVTGTNGKGSTVKLLESIYAKAGYSIASYTSPHLVTFNERIKINGQAINDQQLLAALQRV